jgi:hypothetical protein
MRWQIVDVFAALEFHDDVVSFLEKAEDRMERVASRAQAVAMTVGEGVARIVWHHSVDVDFGHVTAVAVGVRLGAGELVPEIEQLQWRDGEQVHSACFLGFEGGRFPGRPVVYFLRNNAPAARAIAAALRIIELVLVAECVPACAWRTAAGA